MQHYEARDHAFGARLLALRGRAGLSQQEMATRLGVSERAVRAWEAGASYPDPTNMQSLLATYLQQGAFSAGQEGAEAMALWEQARRHSPRFKLPFDPAWFASLLAASTPDATAGASIEPAPPAPAAATPGARRASLPVMAARQDWGEAPDVASFHGRVQELTTLTSWTLSDRCRVVALLGQGGIGKTALAARLAQDLASRFACIFWRSLRNALPFDEWIREAVGVLSDHQQATLPESLDVRLAVLLDLLRSQRCLLVLDNWETVLAPGAPELGYRTGYEGYGTLLRRLGEARHESLLLLTSREQPPELAPLMGAQAAVRALRLGGLGEAESQALLQDRELSGERATWGVLVARYGGNPLALRLVGATIAEVFEGDISAFLAEGATVTGGIRRLLEEQVGRLSPLEQALLTWLAIEREPVGFGELMADLLPPPLFHPANYGRSFPVGYWPMRGPVWEPGVARAQVMEAMEALRHRSLLEPGARGTFTVQPVVLEYLTDRLVEAVAAEIAQAQPGLLMSHALLKAMVKDYVRRSQEQLIAQPLLERLRVTGGSSEVERRLLALLEGWRGRPAEQQGYGPGNVVNLLRLLRGDLRGQDLSRLALRQAYLADVEAQDASVAGAHLEAAVLAEAFNFPTSIALSADGVFLAAGTSTGEVWLWRVADRMPLLAVPGHSGEVVAMALSGDGELLASGGSDGTVKLWAAQQCRNATPSGRPLATLQGHAGGVNRVALRADGRLLASGGQDGTVRLWEAPSGRLLAVLEGHTSEVRGVALSEDGRLLASGSLDGTVRLWEAQSGRPLATLRGHTAGVLGVALSADGGLLASGGMDGTVKLWAAQQCREATPSGQPVATLQGHASAVWNVALSRDGRLVASGDWDRTLRLWEAPSGRPLATFLGHGGAVYGVALSADGSLLASGGQDGTVKLWEAPGGRPLATLQGHTGGIHAVALSADGGLLASGGEDRTVRLWEARRSRPGESVCSLWATQGQPPATLQGHSGGVWVALSGDGRLVASGGFDGTVRLWEVAPSRGRPLATLRGHGGVVFGVALSADGTLLASGGMGGVVKLWEAESGRTLATLQEHSGAVLGVALSADGTLLASGGFDGAVKLWEAPRSRPGESVCSLWANQGRPLATLLGHSGPVRCVALSADGGLLASGGADGTTKLWAIPSGRLLATLLGHTGGVYEVALSGDGALLASVGADGTLKLWATPRSRLGESSVAVVAAPLPAASVRGGSGGEQGRLLATLLGHTGPVRAVALSEDGRLVASGGYDGTVRLWDTSSGACLRVLRPERRYERLDITGLTGVTAAQRSALLALGAMEHDP